MHLRRASSTAIVPCTICSFAAPARAADTIELFAPGASNVEMYLGYEGIGLDEDHRTIFGDTLVGYGLQPWLSAYAGIVLEGSGGSSSGANTNYFGVYGGALDTDHVDLDLIFEVSSGGADQAFQLGPTAELNIDSDPELGGVGLYLRSPIPIYGRKLKPASPQRDASTEVTFMFELTLGAYATLAPGHQLLAEYNMGHHPDPAEGERATEVGGLALGYNVEIVDDLELVDQVFIDIPQGSEQACFAVMLGFIATIPAGGE